MLKVRELVGLDKYMKIIVCVKQTFSIADDDFSFTSDGRAIERKFLEADINESDLYATEEALSLLEQTGDGEVVIVTVGDEGAEEAVLRALAMGADRAIRVQLQPGQESDPLTVSRAIAGVLRDENPDMVFTGVQSNDTVQSATGTALAELLGMPCVAVITSLEYDSSSKRARVHRELEGGVIDVIEVDTPAILTVQTGTNEPRYANLRAIKKAKKKPLAVATANVQETPGYRVKSLYKPAKKEGAEMLDGSASEIAIKIDEIIKERMR